MFKFLKRKMKNVKYPSIKFVMLNNTDTRIEIEWPYTEDDEMKVAIAQTLARTILAMGNGLYSPFIQQQIVEYGKSIGDNKLIIALLASLDYMKSGGSNKQSNNDIPLVRPNQVADIRDMMLQGGMRKAEEE